MWDGTTTTRQWSVSATKRSPAASSAIPPGPSSTPGAITVCTAGAVPPAAAPTPVPTPASEMSPARATDSRRTAHIMPVAAAAGTGGRP